MFFIFVLSHPLNIGDFFRYHCKMDVGVPGVIHTLDHVSKESEFLSVFIDDKEKTLSQMLLVDFYSCLG